MLTGIPLPPTWVAMPPEVNTARLMAGAGPAPMLQAAAGWEGFALLLETQADELAAALSNLASLWGGQASERAINATMPTILWLRTTAAQAMKRALQAANQANSYTLAMATTPPLPEIEQNHVTHGVLESTNFLGVNTVPIGVNEFDYFVRMWNQASGAMDVYQAETQMNSLFEPILPLKPIVIPGVGESGAAAQAATAAARAPMGAVRNAVVSMVSTQGKLESAKLSSGRAMAVGQQAGDKSQSGAKKSEDAASPLMGSGQQMQQGMQMGMQVASQVGSMVTQLPQQMGQMVQTPMQMITQPLQQMSSVFGQMGGLGERNAQMGLLGASPLSNHPLAGGSGSTTGSGLVRAASLPGAGGTSAQTPLMSNLVGGKLDMTPAPVGAGVGPGVVAGGLAPVGGGAGGGMGGPMMGGGKQDSKSGGSKTGLTAPAPLTHDLDEDEGDDW